MDKDLKEVVLQIENLSINYSRKGSQTTILKDISFKVHKGQKVAILGPSGAGKTSLLENIAKLNDWSNDIFISGNIIFQNKSIFDLPSNELPTIRGKDISYIFQEPMACFNPLMPCGKQVLEAYMQHQKDDISIAKTHILSWFSSFQIQDVKKAYDAYPHQLSGGQLQRIMCVIALINNPSLILADEPTSSLDEDNKILFYKKLDEARVKNQTTTMVVTHDWVWAKKWADQIIILDDGELVDIGSVETITKNPKHIFTKALLEFENVRSSLKESFGLDEINQLPNNQIVVEGKKINKRYLYDKGGHQVLDVLSDINFKLNKGRTIGITGSSGSGKSTLARCILRLEDVDSGNIYWSGKEVTNLSFEALRKIRHQIQIVFQDTHLSLPPHLTVRAILEEALSSVDNKKDSVDSLLKSVGLNNDLTTRYPKQLSGGQRQRLCLARVMALQSSVVILDEFISMLDIVSQVNIVTLLMELQKKSSISYILITHDRVWLDIMTDEVLNLNKSVN
ncbi:MAG: ABC transporter ATP-binding protein [Saprospiraceae bacterium]